MKASNARNTKHEYQIALRATSRNSWSEPEPLKPNEPTRIAFAMPDINHNFQKGHRRMLQIQSTWFPLVDRNPRS